MNTTIFKVFNFMIINLAAKFDMINQITGVSITPIDTFIASFCK